MNRELAARVKEEREKLLGEQSSEQSSEQGGGEGPTLPAKQRSFRGAIRGAGPRSVCL